MADEQSNATPSHYNDQAVQFKVALYILAWMIPAMGFFLWAHVSQRFYDGLRYFGAAAMVVLGIAALGLAMKIHANSVEEPCPRAPACDRGGRDTHSP